MSLLIGYEIGYGRFELCCAACVKFIGSITRQEASELMLHNISPLCFECDPLYADSVPQHFISQEDHYFVGIGNYVFLAEWQVDTIYFSPKDLRMTRVNLTTYFDLKTGKGVKYTPLSSTSNLNRLSDENEVFIAIEASNP